ncbi:TcpE family protein [compost metagenome]
MSNPGPFMSYKSIFRRKNRVYKIGDIRIPWGVTLEQFFAIAVVVIVELSLIFATPIINLIGIAGAIIVPVTSTVIVYKLVGEIDFRGMGLINGISTILQWWREPKITLMDEPVERYEKTKVNNSISGGYMSDNNQEMLFIKNLTSISVQGNLVVVMKGDIMTITKRNKLFKKSSILDGSKFKVDSKKPTRLKLRQGIHQFSRLESGTWIYTLGGTSTNVEIPDQSLGGSYNF